MYHFIIICEFKLELQSGNENLGRDLCDLDLWPLTLTFCMDLTLVQCDNSWKFHDDTMMGTWSKRCDRRTDGQTDGQTDRRTENTIHRAAWSQLIMLHETSQITINCTVCSTACSKQNHHNHHHHYHHHFPSYHRLPVEWQEWLWSGQQPIANQSHFVT